VERCISRRKGGGVFDEITEMRIVIVTNRRFH